MHKVFRDEITPGISLTCISTDKFKTGCLTINLIGALRRETASLSALLPRVLRRGSANHPDMAHISTALDELYGTRIEPLIRKKGELHCVGLYTDFPDDRFLPGEQNILEEAATLIGEMLTSPNLQNGIFRKDYVESEKINLVDDIRAAINDKRGYAIDRLLMEMCAGEAYGVRRLGSEEEAQAITPESLTEHYRKLLAESRIEVLYCGSADPNRVIAALRNALSGLEGRKSTPIPETKILLSPPKDSPKRFSEAMDVSQGKLTIGFRVGRSMENPNYPALIVFNSIYGGSITSKLFLNVREKLSLCYYASSMLDKHKGIMLVASGVDFSKFETALDEIMDQLEHIKNGEISQWELLSAKQYVITSLKSAMDRPGGLDELYFDSTVSAVPYDPVDVCDKVDEVTAEQIIEIASGIKPDMTFFLTGLSEERGDSNEA
ncbi:MAG: insulinase family protein [Oscillospiraceae bacterium]|nr:insulinase family protein [Oscillospiraceae bacterium]